MILLRSSIGTIDPFRFLRFQTNAEFSQKTIFFQDAKGRLIFFTNLQASEDEEKYSQNLHTPLRQKRSLQIKILKIPRSLKVYLKCSKKI